MKDLGCGPLSGREWYELLLQKLLPQLDDDAFLVTAVVGGTNIGKSVIFNHLAGERASATSPLASGTKHPVCLVPPGFETKHNLSAIFQGFVLESWSKSEAALEETPQDRLFWRTSSAAPSNLLVLDTPDIDSDAPVNWRRADMIRRCADVLIAVLTQQKYNDSAVKQFFRKAADEDKAIVVVFNQCLLPDDEQYWPIWLNTFCRETGIVPEYIYIAPNDRQAAENNRLPFFERHWSPEESATAAPRQNDRSHSLLEDISRLHFGDIKLRTLRGSLNQVIDVDRGLPSYLRELNAQSDEFASASQLLTAHKLAEIDNWPIVPNSALIAEIRTWWMEQRTGWSAKVHGFYNSVGTGLSWPYRFAREKLAGKAPPPMDFYRQQEWSIILETVDKIFKQLNWICELGHPLLRPRLEALLTGTNRSDVVNYLRKQHETVDLQQELHDRIAAELKSFRDESPDFYLFFKRLDETAAVARPALSIALFVSGFGPAGDAAAQFLGHSAMQSIFHVATEVGGGAVTAAVGETAISSTASSGFGYLEARFRGLHAAFAAGRAQWLAEHIQISLLGRLPEELQSAADIPKSEAFRRVQEILEQLNHFQLTYASESPVTADVHGEGE
ncbi:MAG: GTPase domain-containing protein [Planctomycetaceae bacterium]